MRTTSLRARLVDWLVVTAIMLVIFAIKYFFLEG